MGDYSIGRFPTRLVPRFFRRQRIDALTAPDGASVLELVGVPDAVNGVKVTSAIDGTGPTIYGPAGLDLSSDGPINLNGTAGLTNAVVHALTGKTTPADADELFLVDSAASYVGKKVTVANLRALFSLVSQPRFMTGTVATAAATADKTVTLDSPWSSYTLVSGDMVVLTYTAGNSASGATVAVNGGSAIPVHALSGATINIWHSVESGGQVLYRYDGTYLRPMHTVSIAEITDAEIINPASGGYRLISGTRASYRKRKAIATAVTSSATPALSLDAGDWSTISVGHNITGITLTGTGHNLQTVNLKLVGTGSYTLTFGSAWNFGFGVSAPVSITNGKSHYIFGRYNSTSSKIDVLDVKSEA